MPRRAALAMVLLIGLASAGCQEPTDSASPAASGTPPASSAPGGGATPVAPAIEPQPTGPDPTVELPGDVEFPASGEPVAPAVEPEPTGPDPMLQVAPG